jgi:hypothetical protein
VEQVLIIIKILMSHEVNYGDDYQGAPPVVVNTTPLRRDNFGDDTEPTEPVIKSKIGPVSEPEKLRLAKGILFSALFVLILTAGTLVYFKESEGIEKIWGFVSTATNSIVSLIIGYYFAIKK